MSRTSLRIQPTWLESVFTWYQPPSLSRPTRVTPVPLGSSTEFFRRPPPGTEYIRRPVPATLAGQPTTAAAWVAVGVTVGVGVLVGVGVMVGRAASVCVAPASAVWVG